MKMGIAFDLKPDTPPPPGAPDDIYEEFDAPVTIQAITAVLEGMGHTVRLLGNGPELVAELLKDPPEFVFNFAEGTGSGRSREARVPALCELLNIPYTGSDPLAQAVGLDKDLSRRLAESVGVTVPKGLLFQPDAGPYDGDDSEYLPLLEDAGLTLPVIAKPVHEGSSKGVRSRCLITRLEELGPTIRKLGTDYQQPILVEEFINGLEVTVGLIGNDPPQILGAMAITPKEAVEHFVYSLEVKRDFRALVDYTSPPPIPRSVLRELESSALAVWDVLGCRDVARMDFRIRDNTPYFIEVNPLPGLNPESSDLVIMAGLLNVSHAELVQQIVDAALARCAK